MNWLKTLSGRIRFNEPLSRHTTFRIGGRAKIFFEPKDNEDLRNVLLTAKKRNIPIFIIGAGSNLLVNDKGICGIVIKLNNPFFKNINYEDGLLVAGAGLTLSRLVKSCIDYSLTGLEFLAGIPGTVGGALVMNAGISEKVQTTNPSTTLRIGGERSRTTKNISDLVTDVTVMDYRGRIKVLKKNNIKFDYRSSSLYNYIVLSCRLKLIRGNKRKTRDKICRYLEVRKASQDCSYPNAGCIFKNPKGISAGRLIDLCGLKGRHIKEAFVSEEHANFIINKGKARAGDIISLMDYIKKKVKRRFGVELEPEIRIWH